MTEIGLMKRIAITLAFLMTLSSAGWSETMDDLVKRGNLFYKKFTDVPFSGQVTGQFQGSIENGKEEGCWATYFKNGQLSKKGIYKNGKPDGTWEVYKYDIDSGKYSSSWQIWEQGKERRPTFSQMMYQSFGSTTSADPEFSLELKAYAKKLKEQDCGPE